MGTGITKIKDLCIANNSLVPDFVFDEFFTVIFKREQITERLNGELNEGANEGANEGLILLKFCCTGKIASLTSTPPRRISTGRSQ
jgi:predicted HTH transcriptional regulator